MTIISSIASLGTKAVSAVTGGWIGWAAIGGIFLHQPFASCLQSVQFLHPLFCYPTIAFQTRDILNVTVMREPDVASFAVAPWRLAFQAAPE